MNRSAEHARLDRAAVSSSNLTGRIDANQRFAGADFNGWVRDLIGRLPGRRVLDLCCGTGNQLVAHAGRPECEELVGIDRSTESLATARSRIDEMDFRGTLDLYDFAMDTALGERDLRDRVFDQISCCYGLYYATNVLSLLDKMLGQVAPGGSLLIVGPWGPNNKSLFDLLRKYMTLPPLVERSATTFMTEEVEPYLRDKAEIQTETFVNPVSYPSVQAVLDYWRKTTFFDPAKETDVTRDVEAHFGNADAFVVEKHVMGLIATRR